MRALVFHVSSLVGLLVFLNQLWQAAEIERTIFMAFGSGLAMYMALMIGYAVVHRILKASAAEAAAPLNTSSDKEGTAGGEQAKAPAA